MIRLPGDVGYDHGAAPHEGRIYGKMKAKVTDNADPETRGRLRLFVPSLMSGPATNERQWTDWADPDMPFSDNGDDEVGAIIVPPVGSYVWVEFQQGLFDFPKYTGGFWRRGHKTPQLSRGEDDGTNAGGVTLGPASVSGTTAGASVYPNNRMFKTPGGHIVEVDDTVQNVGETQISRKRIRIRHADGSQMEFQASGDLVLHVIQSFGLVAQALNIISQGSGAIVATDEVILDSLLSVSGVKLGQGAADGVIKGTSRISDEATMLIGLAAFIASLSTATTFTNINSAASAFAPILTTWAGQIAGHVSQKVVTE